jgi:hydrogenase maturation protease
MTRILVAGIGNIFNGDDGFGVATARRLKSRPPRAGVDVIDFGIRGIDLTFALLDTYDAAILLDAAPRGEMPGTLSLIEPEVAETPVPGDLALSPHELDPAKVLGLVAALDGTCKRMLLVACEPLTLGGELGSIGLSGPVAAAIDPAVTLVEDLIDVLRGEGTGPPRQPFTIRPREEREEGATI